MIEWAMTGFLPSGPQALDPPEGKHVKLDPNVLGNPKLSVFAVEQIVAVSQPCLAEYPLLFFFKFFIQRMRSPMTAVNHPFRRAEPIQGSLPGDVVRTRGGVHAPTCQKAPQERSRKGKDPGGD